MTLPVRMMLAICKCGHALDDHHNHSGKCLAHVGDAVCSCRKFRQATRDEARFMAVDLPAGYSKDDFHIWDGTGNTPLVIVKPDGYVWLNPKLTLDDVKTIFRELAKASQ